MLLAGLLICVGICLPATINLLFGWRQRRRVEAYRRGVVYLPWCASAGTVRPGRPS
ncbi:MAG: hypothetical protein H8K10_02025 [Nitrospira sp.]|nr:hypothetical protein [Nitrospira sp.]